MITHLIALEPVWAANRSTGPREVTDDVINSFECITLRLPPLSISLDSENMLFSLHPRAGCLLPALMVHSQMALESYDTELTLAALACLSVACYPLCRGLPLLLFVRGYRHGPAKCYKEHELLCCSSKGTSGFLLNQCHL